MNQKFTRCRKLLLALGLAITQACSHRPAELPSPLSSTSPSLSISEAQTWYQQLDPAAHSTARTSQAGRAAPTVPPTAALRWQRALTVGMGSQQLVLVPFAGDAALFTRTPYVGMRYLVVAKQAPASLDGKIVEVLLSRTTEQVDTLALFTSLYRSAQSGHLAAPGQGAGYVFLYSARYEYLTGRRFAQGQLLPRVSRLAFQARAGTEAASGRTAGHRAPSIGAPCLDWYSGETGKYITTTGDCSGLGSGGSGDVPPVYTGGGGPCGGSCGGSPGPGGYGGGATSPSSTNVVLNVSLVPCQTAVLTGLQGLNNGMLAYIVNKFSGSTPGYNWRLYNGSLPSGINGQTSAYDRTYNVVSTTFDASKFQNANDLSVARTMLHESIHAYLVAYFANTPAYASVGYPDLLAAYAADASNNPNNPQHNTMANGWLIDLAWALEQYGINKGYNLPSQYYSDMAWGGLTTTPAFQALSQSDKDRISNLLSVEQSGNDLNGNPHTQSGSKAGCQ